MAPRKLDYFFYKSYWVRTKRLSSWTNILMGPNQCNFCCCVNQCANIIYAKRVFLLPLAVSRWKGIVRVTSAKAILTLHYSKVLVSYVDKKQPQSAQGESSEKNTSIMRAKVRESRLWSQGVGRVHSRRVGGETRSRLLQALSCYSFPFDCLSAERGAAHGWFISYVEETDTSSI